MKKMSETIVFFGSGPVASKSLELLQEDFEIEAVITKPQPEHHKAKFPVIEVSEKFGLDYYTASNRKELSALFKKHSFNSRVGVIIDHGIIVSQDIIDSFELGIVNSHFSLLPKLRGADPISFSILNGDKKTGVSLMLIVSKMDEGPLISQAELEINSSITSPELTESLIELSHESLKHCLPLYLNGEITPVEQPDTPASYTRKLNKEDSVLDWNKPAAQLEREIRAYIEWPRSRAKINDLDVVITKAHVEADQGTSGQICKLGDKFGFYTSDGILVIDSLIPSGKKQMTASAFMLGYKI